MNPELFNLSIDEEINKDRARGLSEYYSAKRLNLPICLVQTILDSQTLYEGG